jgi:hypothetical protein
LTKSPHLAVVATEEHTGGLPQQMLRDVLMLRGIYALCDIEKGSRLLKTTHYTTMLSGGPAPLWGIWTKRGKFLRFAFKRSGVEQYYPSKSWKRIEASWNIGTIYEHEEIDKTKLLNVHYK